ncbi:methyltransferase domain-containing protein [Solicola sp. PLA-1-18]|uniref:methyltransferase domain-containing protein n=1 Tax=Solicola sp. PLA-1-18 TaxID=3380532 RepID=UPI003B80288D
MDTRTRWDPDTYLRFDDHRSRPFVDLVARVVGEPRTIVDLGCGPGHLTAVLRERWPDADVLGLDSSPSMVERAQAADPDPRSRYELGDLASFAPASPVDLVVSNAAFQWVPRQLEVAARVADHVAPGGTLAIQVPTNGTRPNHALLRQIAAEPRFARHLQDVRPIHDADAEGYLKALARPGWTVDAWTTTYLHLLEGEDPVWSWMSGTGARPYLQALDGDLRDDFERTYRAALREAFPARPYGTVLPFDRAFVVARRDAS